MTQILGNEQQGLAFEIVSARIYEESEDKPHVIYTLQVRHISGNDDLSPSIIERRYTHFLNLYNSLKKEHSVLMTQIGFPKKVLLGNFNNELITTRSTEFENMLKYIASNAKLRTSRGLLDFLQKVEMEKTKLLLNRFDFVQALPLLENNFKLLNKVFTDRFPAVLIALCRLLACGMMIPSCVKCCKWSELAIHRYEGVSDSDLLGLYVPLINACIYVWDQNGKNKDELEYRLQKLKMQGIKVTQQHSLLVEIEIVERKIFESTQP